MEMFYICTAQYGSHWPPVAIEHLAYNEYDWGIKFLVYFILISFR